MAPSGQSKNFHPGQSMPRFIHKKASRVKDRPHDSFSHNTILLKTYKRTMKLFLIPAMLAVAAGQAVSKGHAIISLSE
eukprot:14501451-Ditylum_brightwellii.AAC.1